MSLDALAVVFSVLSVLIDIVILVKIFHSPKVHPPEVRLDPTLDKYGRPLSDPDGSPIETEKRGL
jgi:hypothetical protein